MDPNSSAYLPAYPRTDEDRTVNLVDDDVVLQETTSDDAEFGWTGRIDSNDDRLLEERPPHWC